jgi:hypothetical protein
MGINDEFVLTAPRAQGPTLVDDLMPSVAAVGAFA